MSDCIFCKIIAGDIPADRVYEDELVVAFLDIHPNTKGHTLIIPKKHCADVLEASADMVAAVMAIAQKLAPAVLVATESTGFHLNMNNGASAGQIIFHWHVHVIPRKHPNDWAPPGDHKQYAPGELSALAEKIKALLA